MKRRMLPALLLCVLIVAALSMAGCSGTASGETTEPEVATTATSAQSTTTEAVSTTEPATTEPAATQKTVTDMAGREVTLPAEVTSIATFGAIGVLNAMVESMGCGDRIINQMSAGFTKNDQWKYQYVFAPQIANGPLFENADREIQIEAVLEAAPDLCLCMFKEALAVLEEKGLNVVYLEWKTLDDVEPCITLLGEALGQQEVAADYLKWFDETVTEAEALVANLPEAERKTVLYGSITSYTQPHLIAEWWIPEAGGISVTKDRPTDAESYEYTVEDVLAWNPDVMVVSNAKMIDEIKADERLADVTAVSDGAIYPIPTVAHVWGNRTPEQPLTVMWMMNKLYPEIMTAEMLAEEISYFYEHFFQTKLTQEQLTEIIG
jgi:iron complex transport system substrate-binding protein